METEQEPGGTSFHVKSSFGNGLESGLSGLIGHSTSRVTQRDWLLRPSLTKSDANCRATTRGGSIVGWKRRLQGSSRVGSRKFTSTGGETNSRVSSEKGESDERYRRRGR